MGPKDIDAYNNRGVAYAKKGEYDKAITDYNKAIELNPEYARAYYNRGNAYAEKGEHDKATADYNKAIEIDPEYKSVIGLKNLQDYKIHLTKLIYGYEGTGGKKSHTVHGYLELKEKFMGLSIGWFALTLLIFISFLSCYGYVGFNPLTVLLAIPLGIFVQSYLKYRSLEIKTRHRVALLELKEAKMDMGDVGLKRKDMESIIDHVNDVVFSEVEGKGGNNSINFNSKAL